MKLFKVVCLLLVTSGAFARETIDWKAIDWTKQNWNDPQTGRSFQTLMEIEKAANVANGHYQMFTIQEHGQNKFLRFDTRNGELLELNYKTNPDGSTSSYWIMILKGEI